MSRNLMNVFSRIFTPQVRNASLRAVSLRLTISTQGLVRGLQYQQSFHPLKYGRDSRIRTYNTVFPKDIDESHFTASVI